MMEIISRTEDLERDLPFMLTSGDDGLMLPVLSVGGKGCISVTANIEPARVSGMYRAFQRGDLEEARRIHYEILPLTKTLFMDVNPVPVKRAAELRDLIRSGNVRMPLDQLSPELTDRLREVLSRYD
jgi:4-hydroxy-tetrahydrodipicolinate synthase